MTLESSTTIAFNFFIYLNLQSINGLSEGARVLRAQEVSALRLKSLEEIAVFGDIRAHGFPPPTRR
jgi:hypothetical protein